MVLVLLVGAYLIGTFPTAAIVAGTRGHDVTTEGSRNPGASNVYRVAGARAGLAVFLGDTFKGALGGLAGIVGAHLLDRPDDAIVLALACGIAAVLGHCFPVTRRFRGGKGVATAGGVIFVIEPLVALAGAVLWLGVARVAKKASLASLLTAAFVPAALIALRRSGAELAGVALLALLILARHGENIARLRRGQEHSLEGEDA